MKNSDSVNSEKVESLSLQIPRKLARELERLSKRFHFPTKEAFILYLIQKALEVEVGDGRGDYDLDEDEARKKILKDLGYL